MKDTSGELWRVLCGLSLFGLPFVALRWLETRAPALDVLQEYLAAVGAVAVLLMIAQALDHRR